MFLANKLNKGAGSPAALDAQFNYVTMLLHGDGTNGAQNNTFLDSSTNNFTITRNGNTTQGSFSPYGSNWSNNFVSSATTYFVTPSSSSLALGTGDFTVEAWVNYSSLISGGRGIFQFSATTSLPLNTNSLALGASSNGAIGWNLYANNSDINSGVPVALGTWYHVAVVRSSGTTKLYVNGTSVISQADSKDYTQTYLIIGGFYSTGFLMDGYISNFRVVKGTAVYTANFTPSTTPLTAISGTSLLTCADNRFIDDSTNNFTLTINGTPSVQRFNPFGTSTAYSTSVIGGSGYFDGTGDNLNVANNAVFTLPADFTIECWIFQTGAFQNRLIISKWPTEYYIFTQASGVIGFAWGPFNASGLFGGALLLSSSNAFALNTWTHVAVVRNSNTFTLYVNGISISTATFSTGGTDSGSPVTIGDYGSGGFAFDGYITNARIVKGTAVYTSNFTPPTAPLSAITNTSLLTNFINGAIFDNAMMNNLETVGNAQISTSVVKYGTGSMYFDGSGDALAVSNKVINSLDTGAFTIEMWVYRLGNGTGGSSAYDALLGSNIDGANALYGIYVTRSSGVINFFNSAGLVSSSNSLSNSSWTHIAISRTSANNLQIFINGVSGYSATNTGTGTLINPLFIASDNTTSGNSKFYGYIDDLRITKGYARYTSNFTPPTAAFPNIGPI
jgi:hypothetical protein